MRIGTWDSDAKPREILVIAEVGVNHDGDPAVAHQLVDIASGAGADVVKFQVFNPDLLASASAPLAAYQEASVHEQSQRAMLANLTLPSDAWKELADHASDVGLAFMATAFDQPSLQLLVSIGVPALKVPSGELTNLRFIEQHARVGLPLIISTGMSTMSEVRSAIDAARHARPGVEMAVLHCVSAYPAPLPDLNLRSIPTLSQEFGLTVGYSDHSVGSLAATVAVALGASIVEKHITMDRKREGPDHAASADPESFTQFVSDIRTANGVLGDGVKRPAPCEEPVRLVARRSWHATRQLTPGTVIGPSDIVALRPAEGVAVNEELIGVRVRSPIQAGQPILPEYLDRSVDG